MQKDEIDVILERQTECLSSAQGILSFKMDLLGTQMAVNHAMLLMQLDRIDRKLAANTNLSRNRPTSGKFDLTFLKEYKNCKRIDLSLYEYKV